MAYLETESSPPGTSLCSAERDTAPVRACLGVLRATQDGSSAGKVAEFGSDGQCAKADIGAAIFVSAQRQWRARDRDFSDATFLFPPFCFFPATAMKPADTYLVTLSSTGFAVSFSCVGTLIIIIYY